MSLLRALTLTTTAAFLVLAPLAAVPAGAVGGPLDRRVPAARQATPEPPKKLFTIRDERVGESSGLARASSKFEGLWWTVNDSGDKARVFGVDREGEVRVTLGLNAEVRDVEAVAVDRSGTIYIADIGDNTRSRDQIEIFAIPEPSNLKDVEAVRYHRYDFKYPDGPHDAETLLIDPRTNRLYIVTKTLESTAAIYAAPAQPSREGVNQLTKYSAAPRGTFTDGTFLEDGKHVVLRTYTGIVSLTWSRTPTALGQAVAPLGQGESIGLGLSDNTVLVGFEGKQSPVFEMGVPLGTAQPPTSTKPSAKPTAAAKPGNSTADSTATKNNNLRWILAGAAAFALVVTFITFPPGRRERRDRMAENARLTGQAPRTPHRR